MFKAFSKKENFFSEVPIESEGDSNTASFVDTMSWMSLFFTFVFFCGFQFSYVYTSFNTQNVFNDSVIYYPFKTIRNYTEADFELTIGPISKIHKNVLIQAGLIRDISENPLIFPFSMKGKMIYYNENNNIKEKIIPENTYKVSFKPYETISSEFLFYKHKQVESNRIEIMVTFNGDLEFFTGVSIHYSFSNPNTERFLDSCRIFIFLSLLYSFAGFFYDIFKQKDYNIQNILTIFLAISAVLGINPLGYLSYKIADFGDTYFQFMFFIAYRIYILYILFSLIIPNKLTKNYVIIISLGALLYTLLQYFICVPKGMCSFAPIPLDVSQNHIYFNYLSVTVAFCIIIFTLIVIFLAPQEHFFKAISYGIFIISGAISTIISDGFLYTSDLFRNSCFPSVLYLTTHFLVANVFLFFQNSSSAGYKSIEEKQEELPDEKIYIERESNSDYDSSYFTE